MVIGRPGPSESVSLCGDRATAPIENISVFCFCAFVFCSILFSRERDMRRIDLYEATMMGWGRLDAAQRERFFRAGLKAALRLDRLEFRAWLLRRLQFAPLAAPIDPASFAISDADIAILMRAARHAPGDAAAGPDRDGADGG
jgi:hypothetical protein